MRLFPFIWFTTFETLWRNIRLLTNFFSVHLLFTFPKQFQIKCWWIIGLEKMLGIGVLTARQRSAFLLMFKSRYCVIYIYYSMSLVYTWQSKTTTQIGHYLLQIFCICIIRIVDHHLYRLFGFIFYLILVFFSGYTYICHRQIK